MNMSILRKRVDYPATGVQGLLISNARCFDGERPLPENFSNPPIKMIVKKCECEDFTKCFYEPAPEWEEVLWDEEDIAEALRPNPNSDYRIIAVAFSRYSLKLYLSTEGDDFADTIALSRRKSIDLSFDVYRGKNLTPYTYIVSHSDADLWGNHIIDRRGYVTNVMEYIGDKIMRRFEFGLECPREGVNWSLDTGREYMVVTEYF